MTDVASLGVWPLAGHLCLLVWAFGAHWGGPAPYVPTSLTNRR